MLKIALIKSKENKIQNDSHIEDIYFSVYLTPNDPSFGKYSRATFYKPREPDPFSIKRHTRAKINFRDNN